ncbi:hypothetical protein WOLCODRAFT_163168 [Wolfiporia cocos MD-104 SS10]|uniref:Uncharacterized protein n=1 Tax=Wolfiporia cocos (strain MD-104) TaxID=742152 RepID=A0A2H3JH74_WOLCO|nr:hypothetical protein WOLCODRAFT_163168 [Wolfiporia cocos MD-104 SS10]
MTSSERKFTIPDALQLGAALVGPSGSEAAADIKEVLLRRLEQYRIIIGKSEQSDIPFTASLDYVQLHTATEALYVLELLQSAWREEAAAGPLKAIPAREYDAPEGVIGSRDLAQIRTLIGIVFKWAIEPLLARVVSAIPVRSTPSHVRSGAKIIDLTGVPADFTALTSCTSRLLHLMLPDGPHTPLLQTVITYTLLNKHLIDLLRPCIVLGWLPKTLATESVHPVDELRPPAMHLMSMSVHLLSLPASQTIAAFGGVLADSALPLPYVRKSCGFLLSRQLLRPEGVRGLLAAMFGEEDMSGDDAPLEKLEHIGRLLNTVPASMKAKDYYGVIVPRLVALLSVNPANIPPAHRRAVSFALSRLLASDRGSNVHDVVSSILLPIIHRPFLQLTSPPPGADPEPTPAPAQPVPAAAQDMSPSAALAVLQTLLTNADPSPTFVTNLLTPIVPPLFAILEHLETSKTSDPALKESVRGFLATWGRLVSASDGVDTLWRVVQAEGGDWKSDIAGDLARVEAAARASSLSLFTPEDLRRAEEAGELDADANLLDLRPDPARFVSFLESIERADVSSELFARLLDAYREAKAEADSDPLRTLLYLQLVLQMQTQLAGDDPAAHILSKPDHILTFVKHALETAGPAAPASRADHKHDPSAGLRIQDLRIVPEEEEELEEGDSDDEGPEGEIGGSGDDEMVVTAVNLLLSILEAHPDLSAKTAPILNDILSLLEPLARDSSDTIRPLAREARMVMTARLASTSMPQTKGKTKKARGDEESPEEIYQKALKLLQDPLLPVRAHGLLLLRQLVAAPRTPDGPQLDRALVPAVLSIFLQSVQDDDSYVFLNAVQGLSAMVDGFGADVLRGLVRTYAEGLEGLGGSALTQQDVDVRTRVGEALGQVVRRCGDALPAYVDMLAPPLFGVVRARHLPTTLRTSALALLAQCAETNALALLPYAADLADAMVDLLQVETVPMAQQRAPKRSTVETMDDVDAPAPKLDTEDAQPTSTNSKFPPLRRSALHFLSLLVQACIARVYEGDDGVLAFAPQVLRRAKATLGYVAATDADAVVRVMARETLEGLDQLGTALVGL